MTKKIFISLLFVAIFPILGYSQLTVIYGYVKSNSTNIGIPNHQVNIISSYDSLLNIGINYNSSVFTSSNGFFVDSVTIPSGQNIKFSISTLDCQQSHVNSTFYSSFPLPANLSICNANMNQCYSDFMAYPDTSNHKKLYFYNLASLNITSFLWSFGDGGTSTLANPTHIYSSDGSYIVQLTVNDSISTCSNSKQDTVIVSQILNCQNNFNFYHNSLQINFHGSINSALPTVYKWSFGDNTFATGQNPYHIYANPGTFQVCLHTISINPMSMDSCIASSCKSVIVQGIPTTNIWGQVFEDTGKVDFAQVILYKYNPSNSDYQNFDTTNVVTIDSLNLSYYEFSNIPYGKYLAKAFLTNQSQHLTEFTPTYSGNSIFWNLANPFIINQNVNNNFINLKRVEIAKGIVNMEGRVLEGSAKNPGDPVPEVPIYIYDVQGDIYGFTHSDMQGRYSFNGLEYKKYYIYADFINMDIYPAVIWPDKNNINLTEINIYVNKNTVTSFRDESASISFNIFPIPADNQLTLNLFSIQNSDFSFEILNSLGQIIQKESIQIFKGENKITLNVKDFQNGIYSLMFSSNKEVIFAKKIIISH